MIRRADDPAVATRRSDDAALADEAALLDAILGLVRGIDRVHMSGLLIERSGVALERGLHPVVMTIARLEPVRTTVLAEALALDSSTVSRHLTRLEALGLVERIVDPVDRRASLLSLSSAGHELHRVLTRAWHEILAEQLRRADDGSAGPVAEQLQRLVRALELIPLPSELGRRRRFPD